jgi:hypothetical protein
MKNDFIDDTFGAASYSSYTDPAPKRPDNTWLDQIHHVRQ